MSKRTNSLKSLAILIMLASMITVIGGTQAVSALGRNFFDDTGSDRTDCDVWKQYPAEGSDGGANCGPSRSVSVLASNTQAVPQGVTSVRVYFDGIPTSNGVPVTGTGSIFATNSIYFDIQGANFCPDVVGVRGVNQTDFLNGGYYENHKGSLPQQVTNFKMVGSGTLLTDIGDYRTDGKYCQTNGDSYTYTVHIKASDLTHVEGLGAGRFYATLLVESKTPLGTSGACTKGGAVNNCTGVSNSFSVSLPSGMAYGDIVAADVRGSGGGPDGNNFTLRGGNYDLYGNYATSHNDGKNYTYVARFGADCRVAEAGKRVAAHLALYDIDHADNVANGRIKGLLVKKDSEGNRWRMKPRGYSYTPDTPPGGVWQSVDDDWKVNYEDGITIDPSSDDTDFFNFWAHGGDQYEFFLMDVRPDLVNQIGLPFEGVYYKDPCVIPNPPTGAISLGCYDPATNKQRITYNYADADADDDTKPVRARVVNVATGAVLQTVTAGGIGAAGNGTYDVTYRDPDAASFRLEVKDIGGDGQFKTVATAATVECYREFNCSVSAADFVEQGDPLVVAYTGSIYQSPIMGVKNTVFGTKYNTLFRDTSTGESTTWVANPDPSLAVVPALYSPNLNYSTGAQNLTGRYSLAASMSFLLNGTTITKFCDPDATIVGNKPYFKAYGGDVSTGYGPTNLGTQQCKTATAGISAWNRYQTDINNPGAGSQFGVQALGVITGFASAQQMPVGGEYPLAGGGTAARPANGTGLSFANNSSNADISSGKFGGNYGSQLGCIDYSAGEKPTLTTANLTLGTTGSDTKVELRGQDYVKGHDVYIRGNLVYVEGGAYNIANVPSYRLLVTGGNIYIDKSVEKLYGTYIAQNDGTRGGKIYTCSSAMGVAVRSTTANYYNECQKKLTVYGAFVADQVALMRTYGQLKRSVTDASSTTNSGAEVFIYSPEVWLTKPSGANSLDTFNAITNLPPNL